jgi:hypothetical protein
MPYIFNHCLLFTSYYFSVCFLNAFFIISYCYRGPTPIPHLHTYHFISDETTGGKRLIKTLYQVVSRFMPASFRCNRPAAVIISKDMERYLDGLEIPLYYNDI